MLHPKELSISDFTYHLPDEKIARFPLSERDASRLLIYQNQNIRDGYFNQLPDLFKAGDLLVFNQSRVVQARLHFKTSTAANIEVFCLEPEGQITIPEAMLQQGRATWFCLVGNAKKWKADQVLTIESLSNQKVRLNASLIARKEDGFVVEFFWEDASLYFAEVLEIVGLLPLPPYLKREVSDRDKGTYQTVYATENGSVAAPTAGLHFSSKVLDTLKEKGVNCQNLTLHVGAGTFKPVKAERMNDHVMHSEEVIASLELIDALANCEDKVVAVGTTSFRSLESLYWTAVFLMENPHAPLVIEVSQWQPYEKRTSALPTRKEAFAFLSNALRNAGLKTIQGRTQIIIAPGYSVKVINGLITNFHQPNSTLLLLVSACIGDAWKAVYEHALNNGYRFLSYGDSSYLEIQTKNPG